MIDGEWHGVFSRVKGFASTFSLLGRAMALVIEEKLRKPGSYGSLRN